MTPPADLEPRWAEHTGAWRDPPAVVALSESVLDVDRSSLPGRARGRFWEVLEERGLTLLVGREYEHLVMGLSVLDGRPHQTHLSLPHPSGIAVSPDGERVHIAATRNPNQIVTFAPLTGLRERADLPADPPPGRPLMPVRSRFLPGALYLHDLAFIGDTLHGNAVGENAVVRFGAEGAPERVWWPRSLEADGVPDFTLNYLQLNSIAAGHDLEHSYFSASTERPSRRRPGHQNFPVDGRGVVFSGATREVFARGLTRPHSARLHDDRVWVANSGYGELGYCEDGRFVPHARLSGWARGLCIAGDLAFVGTSRVIPRFAQYAPGLDIAHSMCAVHIVDLSDGRTLGSLIWPQGNQIFAVEAVPSAVTTGFAHLSTGRADSRQMARLYYSFNV